MKDSIILNKNDAIAKGNCRHVFRYNDNKCVKVALQETLEYRRQQQKKKSFLKFLFKPFLRNYNENYDDLRFYKRIIFQNKEDIYNYIPRFYGTVKTNLGMGIVTELLSDEAGGGLPTLLEYTRKNGISQDLIDAIKDIWQNLIKYNITIRAPHTNNFLVKSNNGKLQLFMIDGFGSCNLIPLNDYIPFLGRKKIRKKYNTFIEFLIEENPDFKQYF